MKQKIKNEIEILKQNNDKNFSLVLIFVILALFVYCYFGSFSFFENTFNNVQNLQFWKIIYHNFMSFVLFFIIGIIFTKLIVRQKLSNFGFQVGNAKLGTFICLIAIPIAFLCGLLCVFNSGMTSSYPLIDFNIYGAWWQIALYYISYFCYYIGWEFLFRGMLYFSGEQKCGIISSILLSTLVSALIHTSIGGFGKPLIETLSAIPAGILFGYIAYKTKSIFPSLIIHFLIGLSTDLCIFLLV